METFMIQSHQNFRPKDNENLTNHSQILSLSKLFDCSFHNCLCQRSKIGLILYPKDSQMKNIILLICEQCYNYKSDNHTQHIQLEEWYFNIYKDSKTFQFKSRFLQNDDGSFSFNSTLLDTNSSFDIKERNLEEWEKEIIEQSIMKKSKRIRT
ncbi:hypothetical protein I4U23_017868 [Adineta vaga]|nr:hypothetical protein I4U23_017868 [Adineta vaga]